MSFHNTFDLQKHNIKNLYMYRVRNYTDGNGPASGGYPWTVIPVEDRAAYLEASENSSVVGDIGPFAAFVAAKLARVSIQ